MTKQQIIDRVASKLTGEFYVGQRVRAGWPFPVAGEIVEVTRIRIAAERDLRQSSGAAQCRQVWRAEGAPGAASQDSGAARVTDRELAVARTIAEKLAGPLPRGTRVRWKDVDDYCRRYPVLCGWRLQHRLGQRTDLVHVPRPAGGALVTDDELVSEKVAAKLLGNQFHVGQRVARTLPSFESGTIMLFDGKYKAPAEWHWVYVKFDAGETVRMGTLWLNPI